MITRDNYSQLDRTLQVFVMLHKEKTDFCSWALLSEKTTRFSCTCYQVRAEQYYNSLPKWMLQLHKACNVKPYALALTKYESGKLARSESRTTNKKNPKPTIFTEIALWLHIMAFLGVVTSLLLNILNVPCIRGALF